MATKGKPSARACSAVSHAADPAEEHQRQVHGGAELAGAVEEVRLLVRVGADEVLADGLDALLDQRVAHGGGELAYRGVAAEEVHRVEQGAARGEFEGVDATVLLEPPGHLQALVQPKAAGDAVVHVELGEDRDPVTDGLADGAGGVPGHPGAVGERAAVLVLALVELRAEEGAGEVVVAEVDLDGVEAGLDGEPGGLGVAAGDAGDVLLAWRTTPRLCGLKFGEQDTAGRPLERPSATGPAWPIWAEAAAPSACTASVRRRRPGRASGRIHIWSRSVRPSGATAQ